MRTALQRVPTARRRPSGLKVAAEHIVAAPRASAAGRAATGWRASLWREVTWTLPSLQALASRAALGCCAQLKIERSFQRSGVSSASISGYLS